MLNLDRAQTPISRTVRAKSKYSYKIRHNLALNGLHRGRKGDQCHSCQDCDYANNYGDLT